MILPSEENEQYPSVNGQSVLINRIGTHRLYRLYKEYTVNSFWELNTTKEFDIPELDNVVPISMVFNVYSITVIDNSNRVWLYASAGGTVFSTGTIVTNEGAAPWHWHFSIKNNGTSNAYKATIRCWIDYMI